MDITLIKTRIIDIPAVRKAGLISHDQTIKILHEHGLSADTNTEANKGLLIMNTHFYSYFGIKEVYNYNDLMEWLGY